MFSLFHSILANPDSKIYEVVRYLLEESHENSRTWSIHIRHLAKLYGIADPLELMNGSIPTKSAFKELVKTKIVVFHEKELRAKAAANSKMKYLNISTKGLNGRHHPILSEAVTTTEVKALRPAVKMLLSDYFCYDLKNAQSGGGGHCRLCPAPDGQESPPTENIEHILTKCEGTATIRENKLQELLTIAASAKSDINFDILRCNTDIMTQFILDCSSQNLQNDVRVSINDPQMPRIFIAARHLINGIHCERIKKIKALTKKLN